MEDEVMVPVSGDEMSAVFGGEIQKHGERKVFIFKLIINEKTDK